MHLLTECFHGLDAAGAFPNGHGKYPVPSTLSQLRARQASQASSLEALRRWAEQELAAGLQPLRDGLAEAAESGARGAKVDLSRRAPAGA